MATWEEWFQGMAGKAVDVWADKERADAAADAALQLRAIDPTTGRAYLEGQPNPYKGQALGIEPKWLVLGGLVVVALVIARG